MIKIKINTDKLELEVYKDDQMYYYLIGDASDGPVNVEINDVPLEKLKND
jgi:hypothetical protein